MYPVLITLGRFSIRTYGVIVAIATITGIFVALHYAKTYQGIDEDSFLNFTIWTIIGGILGARIFWILVSPGADFYFKNPQHILAVWEGGLSFEGMLLGGIVTAFFAARHYKLSFFKLLDSAAPALAIGYGIGKFACFFNGCCHGIVVPQWWPHFFPFVNVFTDPRSECEILNKPLYPTQLLNSLGGWITFFVLIYFVRKGRPTYHGNVFVIFSFVFSAFLFLVDFIRYIPTRFLSLTPNQWSALGFVIFAIVLDRILRKSLPIEKNS
jgi:phosphatidylglycerol:prolipoprotein diacylglycerol transferase